MTLKKGDVVIYSGTNRDEIPHAHVVGVEYLSIQTQEELDALHRLVAEGKPLPLKPAAPGQRVRYPKHYSDT